MEPGGLEPAAERRQTSGRMVLMARRNIFGIKYPTLQHSREADTYHSLVEFPPVEEHGALIDSPEGTLGR